MAGKKGRRPGSRALQIVQKFVPSVTKIMDATADLTIEVTKANTQSKAVRNHQECALAVACKDKKHLDDVVISRSMAYLVKGKVATRYQLPEHVSREVIAFDRGGTFAPGEYELKKPEPHIALDSPRQSHGGETHRGAGGRGQAHHLTANIRANLHAKRARSDAD